MVDNGFFGFAHTHTNEIPTATSYIHFLPFDCLIAKCAKDKINNEFM